MSLPAPGGTGGAAGLQQHTAQLAALLRMPPVRYALAALGAIVLLHLTASIASPTYADRTALVGGSLLGGAGIGSGAGSGTVWSHGSKQRGSSIFADPGNLAGVAANASALANATFVILARNSDLWEILSSIRAVEDRFNERYHYPYTFLNDEPFSDEFKLHTSSIASGSCTYGLIDKREWSEQPDWIDQDKAAKARDEMQRNKVIYGGSLSYRLMCRYQSGFFWRHPLLDKYKYYWRIEPNVKYFCDIGYDPFKLMQDQGKKYGFTVTIYEYAETIPSLWDVTKEFIKENPQYVPKRNMMKFLSDDGGETYNRCHYWSNFEIGDLDFWRSEAYTKYFDALDRAGGFFYERWGDAPVHSIAASLFLQPEEMHFFHDIGYRHEPFQHCPQDSADKCYCNPKDGNNFEFHWYSCTPKWKEAAGWKKPS